MVEIVGVEKNSHAAKAHILPGDLLVSINGNAVTDVLDYRFYITEEKLDIALDRRGEAVRVLIKKEQYDDIGLEFATYLMDKKHSCRNKCVFCFIDQNPPGMREDIYFKDDDSRLSFFFGNYITLTNLTDADIDRVIKMRISPINISVHTTNPDLRVKMMNNKNAGASLRFLDRLRDGDISMNAQIVLCKGLNDKAELDRTLNDLSAYYPHIESIAVVPSGLTKHREGLYPLEMFTRDEAREVIAQIDRKRAENEKEFGERIIQAADEWYLKAELPLPNEDYYDGYPQLDNGVGCITSQKNEIDDEIEILFEDGFSLDEPREVAVATGLAAYDFIQSSAAKLEKAFPQLRVHVYGVVNRFFGESITVSGLLTGGDMVDFLKDKPLGKVLFIPSVTLRHEGDLFLDDMSLDEFKQTLELPVIPITNDGAEFVRALLGADE